MSTQDLERTTEPRAGATAAAVSPTGPAGRARRKPVDPVLLERLAETGFLATEFDLNDHAERIFVCLAKLKPGKPSPRIALAMVQARRGRMEDAIAAMRQLIDERPDCELARAVLGTMLLHVGQAGAQQLLEDVIARGTDQRAISVAASCIEQARAQEEQSSGAAEGMFELCRHHNIRA